MEAYREMYEKVFCSFALAASHTDSHVRRISPTISLEFGSSKLVLLQNEHFRPSYSISARYYCELAKWWQDVNVKILFMFLKSFV